MSKDDYQKFLNNYPDIGNLIEPIKFGEHNITYLFSFLQQGYIIIDKFIKSDFSKFKQIQKEIKQILVRHNIMVEELTDYEYYPLKMLLDRRKEEETDFVLKQIEIWKKKKMMMILTSCRCKTIRLITSTELLPGGKRLTGPKNIFSCLMT